MTSSFSSELVFTEPGLPNCHLSKNSDHPLWKFQHLEEFDFMVTPGHLLVQVFDPSPTRADADCLRGFQGPGSWTGS